MWPSNRRRTTRKPSKLKSHRQASTFITDTLRVQHLAKSEQESLIRQHVHIQTSRATRRHHQVNAINPRRKWELTTEDETVALNKKETCRKSINVNGSRPEGCRDCQHRDSSRAAGNLSTNQPGNQSGLSIPACSNCSTIWLVRRSIICQATLASSLRAAWKTADCCSRRASSGTSLASWPPAWPMTSRAAVNLAASTCCKPVSAPAKASMQSNSKSTLLRSWFDKSARRCASTGLSSLAGAPRA